MVPDLLRRLPLALLVVLTVALVAGAGLGVASSPGGKDLPDSFQLAAPMAGDSGSWETTYGPTEPAEAMQAVQTESSTQQDLEQSGSASADGGPAFRSNFEWLPEQAWQDGFGVWHAVHGLLIVDPDHGNTATSNGRTTFTPGWSIDWVETTTGRSVGSTGLGGGGASSRSGLVEGEESILYTNTVTRWDTEEPCTLAEALRAGVDLGKAIAVTGCAADSFKARGTETINGVEAVRFEGSGESGSASCWFNPGIPTPLRVLTSSHREGEADFVIDSVLTSFTRGDGAWDTGLQLPAAQVLPAIQVGPLEPWGPDETGVVHPFPASQAWTLARDDLQFTDFGDFLAAHPEAAAAESSYTEERRGSETQRIWSFLVMADDGSNFFLDAFQVEQPADGVLADLLGQPTRTSAVVTHEFRGGSGGASGYLLPSERPASAPTVASIQAYRAALNGSGEPGNSWGLGNCFGPCTTGLAVVVGQSSMDVPASGLMGASGTATLVGSTMGFDLDGTLLHATAIDYDFTGKAGLLKAGASVSGGAVLVTKAPGSAMLQGAISPWTLPPGAATGVGFLATLSGALALLWPALKGGSLAGLFSRVQGERVLDHPVRARIVALVEATPGLHYQELLRAVGGGKGALEHHLRMLEDAQALAVVRGGRYTCYFPRGTQQAMQHALPALKSPSARRVLGTIQAQPGISGQQVSTLTGLSASSVSEHVARLSAAGLVAATRTGRVVQFQATPLADQAAAA